MLPPEIPPNSPVADVVDDDEEDEDIVKKSLMSPASAEPDDADELGDARLCSNVVIACESGACELSAVWPTTPTVSMVDGVGATANPGPEYIGAESNSGAKPPKSTADPRLPNAPRLESRPRWAQAIWQAR